MKHLPYVCLLTLGSASAFAASAPSSLFASNVEVSYVQQSTDGISGHLNGWELSATAYLGSSDVFVNAQTSVGGDLGNGGGSVHGNRTGDAQRSESTDQSNPCGPGG